MFPIIYNGRERIRTSGAINTVVFKTTALNHSATLPYCKQFLHPLELFFKIIEQLIVICQDIVSINLGSIVSPPIPDDLFTLSIDLKAFIGMQITFVLGIQVDHYLSSKSSLRTFRLRRFSWYSKSLFVRTP